jgi:hypothetical protein
MKDKNYKLRSRLWSLGGYLTLLVSTVGGFLVYGLATDWNQFRDELENFVVVQEETIKLNMVIALPLLISALIFIFVVGRKNREFFQNKLSLSILTTLVIFYLIYSVIELTLFALLGAFIGSMFDDFVFSAIAKKNLKLSEEQKDIEYEYDREKRRIKARQQAREELDGTV